MPLNPLVFQKSHLCFTSSAPAKNHKSDKTIAFSIKEMDILSILAKAPLTLTQKDIEMANSVTTRHLDLGCGVAPRNPFQHKELFGCDIRDISDTDTELGFNYKKINLIQEAIPFPDRFFDSISAFDFLEHVPRQFLSSQGTLINPFVALMSEVHRVLVPGGRLIAITPAFPRPEAFQDPTHVNFITEKTHEYFVGEQPYAAAYGFKGRFEVVNVYWSAPKNAHNALEPRWRKSIRNFEHTVFKNGLSHILWDLRAV